MKPNTLPQRLAVGSVYFAANARLLVDSLFNAGGTASGTFKARERAVLFSDGKDEPFAALVANPGQSRFFVSCSRSEADGGRVRYMFGLADSDAIKLGLAGMRYSAICDEADRVWEAVKPRAVPVEA